MAECYINEFTKEESKKIRPDVLKACTLILEHALSQNKKENRGKQFTSFYTKDELSKACQILKVIAKTQNNKKLLKFYYKIEKKIKKGDF